MTDRTIGEAAELLGVTTRTLRHWDSIGLLVPGWRTWADYRLYTEDDIERAMRILVYRSAGVPLKEIGELIDAPSLTAAAHLRRQRVLLEEQIGHLHRMVRAVDEILKGNDMSIEEKVELFGKEWPNYQAEAEERWGDTPEWEESQRRQEAMTRDDWVKVRDEVEAFATALADAASRDVEPGSEEGDELALRHRASIDMWYEASPSKQVLLARMYTQDPRFDETYGGHSEYLLKLVEARAEKDGVDLSDVQWC